VAVIVAPDIAQAGGSRGVSPWSEGRPGVPQVKVAPRRVAVKPDSSWFMREFGETEEEQKAASGISPPRRRGDPPDLVAPKRSKKKRVNFGAFEGY